MKLKLKPRILGDVMILHLPIEISEGFPSRGLHMAEGNLLGKPFVFPLEPDGRGSHFIELSKEQRDEIQKNSLEEVDLDLELLQHWPDPPLSKELKEQLVKDQLEETWSSLTVKAKWEWIRWIRSTKNEKTKEKRIQVTSSKLQAGQRRPCCFNTATCTLPEISRGGLLKLED